MIQPSAPEQIVLQATRYRQYVRVEIKSATGVWKDYSNYVNLDMQDRVEVTIDADARIAQATIELIRETDGGNTIAPLLNSDIAVGRAIRISAARVAAESTPSSSDYKPVFEGEVDEWGHPEVSGEADDNRLVLVARDGMGKLHDRWVEEETEYGSDNGTPLEDVMQEILDDWCDGMQLYVPSATQVAAGRYRQERSTVLEALETLAGLIGWVIEWRWHSATARWRLTLYEPDRTPAAPQWTFGPDEYFAVTGLKVSRHHIRNVITVRYTNSATGARSSYTASSPTSISKYGRRWMELEEADDSPINSPSSAQRMADPALLDLAEPDADQEIVVPFFWPIQLGDYYGFEGNGVHYDVDQEFGVVGYTHTFENGEGLTRIRTRGKPVGSIRGWIQREHRSRPVEEVLAGISLINFREISRTATTVTYGWTLGADLAAAWIHDYQEDQPYADDKWPDETRLPDVIEPARNATYTVDIPEQGKVGYLQVEGRRADGSIGQMERVLIFPSNIEGDFIAFVSAVVNQADGSVKITGWSTDRARSVAYAYNVGDATVSAPTIAQVEAQGIGATGGGLVSGFTSDFTIELPPGTVDFGEVIKGMVVAYIRDDGKGPDGTAQDHGDPVGFQGERFKITLEGQIENGVIISQKLREGAQRISFPADTFTAVDRDTVAWDSFVLRLAGGAEYAILSGNTGNMTDNDPRYIYFDLDESSTELQVSLATTDALGDGKILLAVAWRGPAAGQEAAYVPVAGMLGINETVIGPNSISTSKIQALAITAGLIAAGAVTAAKINVASLSAISADLGTVTAGTIEANVIVSSELFDANTAVFTGNLQVDSAVLLLDELQHDGNRLGFYGTTAILKQTGVGTDALSIHTALVNLGLFSG